MRVFTAERLGLVFLLGEELLVILCGSGLWGNLWGILELLSDLLLGFKLSSSLGESSREILGEILLDGARKLSLGILRELLLLLLDEDGLKLRIHEGLAFALILGLAEIVKNGVLLLLGGSNCDILFLLSESESHGSSIFLVDIESDSAVEFCDAVLRCTISGRFANFIDMIKRGIKWKRTINQIISATIVIIGIFAGESITTLSALLTVASDEDCDHARNHKHREKADEAARNGRIKSLVVFG